MANKLSSTNIAELLEEHLKSINDINEVIVNSKIDAAKVKAISEFVKPLNESIASLNSIQAELSSFNGSSFVSDIKVKNGVKSIISTLQTILEELNGFEIDSSKMKEFQKSFKPISEVLKTFSEVNKLLGGTEIGVKNKVKTKIAIKGLVDIIKTINDNIKGIEVDEEAAKKLKSVTEAISELSESVKSLMFVAITAPILVMLSPLINKSISVIVSIMQKLAEAGDTDAAAQAATSAATIGEALAQFAKGILMFVLATMGGVVILLAIVAILALKVFMIVFNKLFDEEQAAKTLVAMSVMQQMGKSMMVLSLTIILWALTGILIMESMKEILVTILFVTLAIFVYALLGKMSKHIAVGNKTMLLVAGTLIILSMTVLLWALTGELIAEEWKNILITIAFVTIAILVFTLLGFLNKFIGGGGKTMLMVALILIILSLTVLLWAETGQTIMDNWVQVLVVSGFVIIMIGLMFLLSLVNRSIQGGMRTMLILAITLVILSLTVLLWAETGQTVMDNWVQVLVVGGFVMICIGILFILGKMTGNMMQGAVALLVMAFGLVLLSGAAALMVVVGNLILENWVAMLIMMAFTVLIVGIFAVIGIPAVAAFVALGAVVLLLMGAALLVFSVAALLLVVVAKQLDLETVGVMLALIGGLGLTVAALGVISPLIILGAAALGILGAALIIFMIPVLMFAGVVAIFKKINAKEEEIIKPIELMGKMVDAVNDSISLLAAGEASLKMMALLPAIASIGFMAKTLQFIAALNMPTEWDENGDPKSFQQMKSEDFITAAMNAVAITKILANLFGEEDVEVEVLGQKIKISPVSKKELEGITVEALLKMAMLAGITACIGNMAETLQGIASLNLPTSWDEEGKPNEFRSMGSEDFIAAATNACGIAKILANLFGEQPIEVEVMGQKVKLNPVTQKELDGITWSAKNKMSRLSEITTHLANMAETLQFIASLNMPTEWDEEGKPIKFNPMTSDDFISAATNACGIAKIMANLFGENPIDVEVMGQKVKLNPISQKELEGITRSGKKKMGFLAEITGSIGQMAVTLQNMASLNIPLAWDETGKPIEFRPMTSEDFLTAADNAAVITTTLIRALTDHKHPQTGKTVAESVEDMSKRTVEKIKEILNALGNLKNIVEVIQQMVQMTVPTEYDSEGKPIAWRAITPGEIEQAKNNAVMLMCDFLYAMADEKLSETLEDMDSDASENMNLVMQSTGGIVSLIDAIKKAGEFDKVKIANGIGMMKEAVLRYVGMLNDLFVDKWGWGRSTGKIFGISVSIPVYKIIDEAEVSVKNLNSAAEKMKKITDTTNPLKSLVDAIASLSQDENANIANSGIDLLKTVVTRYTQIFTGDENGKGGVNITPAGEKKFHRFRQMVRYQDYFSKLQTKDLQANTDQFVRFIDKANTIDTEKITTVKDMFQQMAEFSKSVHGDFDRLADVLSEKLCTILEKLQKTLDDVANMDSPDPKSHTDGENPTGGENPTPDKDKNNKDKKLEKNFKDIKDSLDDMISLLTSVKNNTDNL